MITRDQLKQMNEDDLRTKVLIPLFRAMGFRDVFDHHGGPLELGKDIVMWRDDSIGNRGNYAVVAKARRITGKAASGRGNIPEVKTQIEQCFGSSYKDSVRGSEQWIQQCYVVSSHRIRKETIDALTSALKPQGLDRSVTFINGDKLWELVERHLIQETLWEHIRKADEILDSASPYYRLNLHTSAGMKRIDVVERYPGASRDHPITFSGRLTLSDTPEGRKVRRDLEALHRRGTPVEIRKPYIEGFEPPDFITRVMESPVELSTLRLQSRPSDEPLSVRINVIPSDGEPSALEHVELVRHRVGSEEVSLSNEKQGIPVKFGLTLNIAAKRAQLDFRCSFENLNVKQVLDYLRLQNALSKDGAIIINKTTDGLELLNLPIEEGQFDPPSEHWIRLLEDLVFIQTQTRCQIRFPARGITQEDLNTVAKVRHILTTGQIDGTWDSFIPELCKKGVENFLNTIKSTPNQAIPLVLETEETEQVLGTEIPLGSVRICLAQAILENEEEELERFLRTASEKDRLQLRFRPHESNQAVVSHYVNWGIEV